MKKKILFALLVVLFYFLPTFIQPIFVENNKVAGITFGLPTTQTGDEPHNYIVLYSIVNDGDFFLTNNYNNAIYNSGPDLGKKKFSEYDRHTQLFDCKKRKLQSMFVGKKSIELSYIPKEKSSLKEVSLHPIGLPVFVSLFLWPFVNTSLLEHFAIYLTLIFSLIGVYCFYKIISYYHDDENTALFYTFIFVFATQFWHYSKTFWSDSYISSFLIIAWYLILVKRTILSCALAGLILGIGFTMKYPFFLIVVPFGLYVLLKKSIKKVIAFSIPFTFCFILVLMFNYYLTSNPLQFNQIDAVVFTNPFTGVIMWLFNIKFGLIIFSPILLFTIFGVKNFWNHNRGHALTALSSILFYFCFWASYIVAQKGAGGYSARYLIPIIAPLIFIMSFARLEKSKSAVIKYFFYISLLLSFIINFLAAFAYPAFTEYPIYVSFIKIGSFLYNHF